MAITFNQVPDWTSWENQASIPGSHTIAPPGWYMLFITDRDGVPSVAHWVHLS